MPEITPFDVCIIGGGFTGTATAIHLLQKARQPMRIALVNAHRPFCRGVAYSTAEPFHLLNVMAENMSLYTEQPNHFVDWLARKQIYPSGTNLKTQFAPRMIYGQYVEEQLTAAQSYSLATVEMIEQEAVSLSGNSKGYEITVQGSSGLKHLQAQKIFLALGNAQPCNILASFHISAETKNYYANPWNFAAIKRIPKHSDIFIIGSGLTTVDILLTLKRQFHQGKIHILSLHGFMPLCHEPYSPKDLLFDTQNFTSARKALRYVRSQISEQANWRLVIDKLRPHTQTIWDNWSPPEKSTFLRHLRALWEVHRHRIAPQVQDEIQTLFATGQAQLMAGRIKAVHCESPKFKIEYVERPSQQSNKLSSDVMINATGPNYLSYSEHPLLQSILSQDLTSWDPFKLGLTVSPHSTLLNPQGIESKQIYALGPLTKSKFWEIIAVPDIRRQVDSAVNHVLGC